MKVDSKEPSKTTSYHVAYWHDYRFELVGVTYKVNSIIEAINSYTEDKNTPSMDRIKYVLAVGENDNKIKPYVPSNS